MSKSTYNWDALGLRHQDCDEDSHDEYPARKEEEDAPLRKIKHPMSQHIEMQS